MKFAVLISAVAMLGSALSVEGRKKPDKGDVESWANRWQDEVIGQASPIPKLLFSLPPTPLKTTSWNLTWLTDEELRPFQCLSPNAKLIDLTNQMEVLDAVFWELVTTDGLIIGVDQRPKDPIPGSHIIYSINCKPRWEAFWIKPLPVPSAIRSTAFTRELLQEDDKLSWRAVWKVLNPPPSHPSQKP